MLTLTNLLTPYVQRVEAEMRHMIPSLNQHRPFFGQIHYHLGWANSAFEAETQRGGKRVRATFCLMAAEAFCGHIEPALSAAVAFELLHEFTLIHDDIEDGDRSRRHRPTLWTIVGIPQAINAGDGLFSLAQQALLHSQTRNIPAERVLDAQQRFNAAVLKICLGQHLDMAFESRCTVSPDEYLEMISGKTAALLACSGEVGALLAGAEEDDIAAMREIGESAGLAFQMCDDLLGIWGDPTRTGKPVGADIRAKKKSLPVAYALNQPNSDALHALYATPLSKESQIAEATRLIEATGARDYVIELARQQEQRALAHLSHLSAPPERLAPLRQLVQKLTQRDY